MKILLCKVFSIVKYGKSVKKLGKVQKYAVVKK